MAQVCYVCRTNSPNFLKNGRQIFSEFAFLPSNKLLSDVIGEILERTVTENEAHSKVLCIRCANTVMEYDLFQTKIQTLKTKLQLEWAKGENMQKMVTITKKSSPIKPQTKVVLPASKLQPLPQNFVLNAQSLQNAKLAPKFVKVSNALKKPSTITSATQPTAIKANIADLSNKIIANSLKESLPKTDSLMNLNLESLPNDFMASITKCDPLSEPLNDSMEIDEECAVTVVPFTSNKMDKTTGDDISDDRGDDNGDHFVALMSDKDDSNEVIFSEFNVVDADDNNSGQHTLVVDSTNGDALLRLMVGQKLMYGDKQISLVMKQSDDAQESDIELRLSGDEETANAIMAAQKHGSSYIKLENGDIFEVQCVESQSDEQISNTDVISMIRREDSGMFTCLLCQKNQDIESDPFISEADSMMEHLKTIHSARLYICSTCGYFVRKRAEYNKHLEEHSRKTTTYVTNEESKFECNQCHKTYVSKAILMEHLLTHGTGMKSYFCKMCEKSFVSKYTLQTHLKTHTKRSRPFNCELCSKSFMSGNNLRQHEKTHSSIKEFFCSVCDKAFGTQHSLEVHSVVHTRVKKFLCDVCNKGFARKQEVVDHIRTHTGEKPFKCSICGDSFAQRSNLHSHKRHTHTDERRYACTHCTKKFKRRRLLDYHIKARHTGERPLSCAECGATFVYPEHYKKHLLLHTGAKPYSCDICGKSFNSRDNRNTHIFVHSDKKPYECVVCGVGYMRKQALYTHMHQSGHLAETIVVNHPRVENVIDKVVLETSDNNQTNDNTVDEENNELDVTGEKRDVELLAYNIDPASIKTDTLLEEGTVINGYNEAWEEGMIRIVEIQLPNGNNGWVAINS